MRLICPRVRRYQKACAIHEEGKKARVLAQSHAARYDAMTSVLKGLDAYRAELASQLPAGLELRDGELWIEVQPPGKKRVWVQYDKANKGSRLPVAALVSALRVKRSPWPIIVIDDAEALDDENLLTTLRALWAHPVQVLAARVSNAPFEVKQYDFDSREGAA